MNGAMALKVPYGFKYEDELEQEKPFVPEPIEDGGKKLALALGGLAVANLTSLLMLNELNVDKNKFKKPKQAVLKVQDEYLEDETDFDEEDGEIDYKIDDAIDEIDEIDEAQIQAQISKNIFQTAAHSITRNVKKYEKIIQNSSQSSIHGFLTMKNKSFNPFG